jgi:hypothetical protein
MDDIIQLKITLKGTKPPIWRRVLVDKATTFFELHNIIQIAMGWTNSHLHEFEINGFRIAEQNEEFDDDVPQSWHVGHELAQCARLYKGNADKLAAARTAALHARDTLAFLRHAGFSRFAGKISD